MVVLRLGCAGTHCKTLGWLTLASFSPKAISKSPRVQGFCHTRGDAGACFVLTLPWEMKHGWPCREEMLNTKCWGRGRPNPTWLLVGLRRVGPCPGEPSWIEKSVFHTFRKPGRENRLAEPLLKTAFPSHPLAGAGAPQKCANEDWLI